MGGGTYSTDEVIIGTWIDGKPLYQKSIQFTTNTTALQMKEIDTGITNGKKGQIVGGYIEALSENLMPLNYYAGASIYGYTALTAGLTKIQNISHVSGTAGVVTIQYTKSTD